MTLRPDPFTEIREARDDKWLAALERAHRHVPLAIYDEDLKPAQTAVGEMLAEIDRLEREAAEREAALRAMMTTPSGEGQEELAKARRGEGLTDMETLFALRGAMEVVDVMLAERKTLRLESEARVREVEAERDAYRRAKAENDERFQLRAEAAEATVARQAETLRQIAESYPWEPFEDGETIRKPHEQLMGVVARCVGCKATKDVGPDEGQPFCEKCGSVMVAMRAWYETESPTNRARARAVLASPEAADTMIVSSDHRAEAAAAEPREGPCECGHTRIEHWFLVTGASCSSGRCDCTEFRPRAAALPAVDAPATPDPVYDADGNATGATNVSGARYVEAPAVDAPPEPTT